MVTPGTSFTGSLKVLERIRSKTSLPRILDAANDHAAQLLQIHARYAEASGLELLANNLVKLNDALVEARQQKHSCLLCLGWGGGFLSKTAFLDTENDVYRSLLRRLPYYERAIRSGMPFPKTRRIVYQDGQPATIPGWALLTAA
ncbi:MAG: hypothetical protein WKF37_05210 [Bryobacteraceae bacterium]